MAEPLVRRGNWQNTAASGRPEAIKLGEYRPLPTADPGSHRSVARSQTVGGSRSEGSRKTPQNVAAKILEYKRNSANAPPQYRDVFLERILESSIFQTSMAALILGNAIVMGLETDMSQWKHWDEVENGFLFAFVVEVVMKLKAQGLVFFFSSHNPDITWNMFDLFIVGLGGIDFLATAILDKSSNSVATLFRIIRLLRMLRLFRIIKFLKQLYLLAYGFIEALQAIMWVSFVMIIALYVCSIVAVRTVGRLPKSDPHAEFLHEQFMDIRTSMLTLFALMSSPNLHMFMEQDGLVWERPLLLLFLIAFIIFGSFGMIALLTGVISESMFEKNQLRVEEARREKEELMQALHQRAEEIHSCLNLDEDGGARSEDVRKFAMPQIGELFESLGVDYTIREISDLVDIMDADRSNSIDAHEFAHSIVTFAGGVKALSIQEVHHSVQVCASHLEMLRTEMATVLKHIQLAENSEHQTARPPTQVDDEPVQLQTSLRRRLSRMAIPLPQDLGASLSAAEATSCQDVVLPLGRCEDIGAAMPSVCHEGSDASEAISCQDEVPPLGRSEDIGVAMSSVFRDGTVASEASGQDAVPPLGICEALVQQIFQEASSNSSSSRMPASRPHRAGLPQHAETAQAPSSDGAVVSLSPMSSLSALANPASAGLLAQPLLEEGLLHATVAQDQLDATLLEQMREAAGRLSRSEGDAPQQVQSPTTGNWQRRLNRRSLSEADKMRDT